MLVLLHPPCAWQIFSSLLLHNPPAYLPTLSSLHNSSPQISGPEHGPSSQLPQIESKETICHVPTALRGGSCHLTCYWKHSQPLPVPPPSPPPLLWQAGCAAATFHCTVYCQWATAANHWSSGFSNTVWTNMVWVAKLRVPGDRDSGLGIPCRRLSIAAASDQSACNLSTAEQTGSFFLLSPAPSLQSGSWTDSDTVLLTLSGGVGCLRLHC